MTTSQTAMTAEEYAARLLAHVLQRGDTPDIAGIADESALTIRQVEAIRDRLLSGRRDAGYRAPARNVTAIKALEPAPAPVEDWRRALDYPPTSRIHRKAEKVQALIDELLADLAADSEKAELRAKEAKLVAALAKVRAELRGDQPAPEKVPCPDCGGLVRPDRIKQHALRSAKHKG